MEISIKSILTIFEPFFAFVATLSLLDRGFFDDINLLNKAIEEMIRIIMAILFSVYYIIKIVRWIEIKDKVSDIEKRITILEELGKNENN